MTTDFWFPAKRYGWGWGLPVKWQGWAVMAVYVALMMLAAFLSPPPRRVIEFVSMTLALSAGFVAVCWAKGEPPRWRWGK